MDDLAKAKWENAYKLLELEGLELGGIEKDARVAINWRVLGACRCMFLCILCVCVFDGNFQ